MNKETISAFRFRRYWPFTAFSCLCFTMQFPAKIASSCIWVAIPVDWVILHWYACDADGRSFRRSVYGHVIAKFSGMGRFTYPWCSADTHESSANNNALNHASEDVYFLVFTEIKVVKTNLMAREYTINKVYYYCYRIINITRAWLITKCNGQFLQTAKTFLLQSATEFTTIYDDTYYQVGWLLQIATVHIGYFIL